MASPVYGTDLAGYMNILAGQAKGMNEANRLKRIQQQQDFSNAMQMVSMADQTAARDQLRQQQYDWNAYNAAMNQSRQQQQYDWDVYDRTFNNKRTAFSQDMQGKQFDRLLANDAYAKEMDLFKLGLQQQRAATQKQPSISQAKAIAEAQQQAYSPGSTPEEQMMGQSILQNAGLPTYEGPTQLPESRQIGTLNRVLQGANMLFNPFGDPAKEDAHEFLTGYSRTDRQSELAELNSIFVELMNYKKQYGQLPQNLIPLANDIFKKISELSPGR